MEICLDPGHGGTDPGAVAFGLQEKHLNLAISLFTAEALEAAGHRVIMTRRMDRSLRLSPRAGFANRNGADRFLSIHCNAAGIATASGIETFNFPGSINGGALARAVQGSLMAEFPEHRNRGVKEANWTVLRETRMPAVLIECEFMTHPQQADFLRDEANQRRLGQAIARAMG